MYTVLDVDCSSRYTGTFMQREIESNMFISRVTHNMLLHGDTKNRYAIGEHKLLLVLSAATC